jgi:hypothetical protein
MKVIKVLLTILLVGMLAIPFNACQRLNPASKETISEEEGKDQKPGDKDDGFDNFVELTDTLAKISRKELSNTPLTRDELRFIEKYGGYLEGLMLTIANLGQEGRTTSWWEIENKTDRSMALVADVHTSMPNVLEEAVGNAAEIWVVAPVNGKLLLTRGAIFTYYEFTQPATNRLTDEAWQQRVRSGKTPPLPGWTKDFLLGPGLNTPTPTYQFDIGDLGC